MASKEEVKLADYVSECFEWSQASYRSNHDKFLDRYRQFRQIYPKNLGTKSKLFIPKTTALILNLVPRLLGDEPTIKVQATGATPSGNARAQELALEFETDQMDYLLRLYFLVMDASIYGHGVHQNIWWTQIEAIRRRLQPFEIENIREQGKNVPPFMMDTNMVYDGPWSNDIDCFDWYPDPSHPRVADADFGIMTDRMSPMDMGALEELNFLRGVETYLDKVKNSPSASGTGEREAESRKQQRDADVGNDHGKSFIDRAPSYLRPHNLIDFWGKVPMELVPRKIAESVRSNARKAGISKTPRYVKMNIVQTMGKDVLRKAPFPYFHNELPFVEAMIVPLKGEHVGLGMCELVGELQDHENYRRNIMIDNLNRLGNGMYTKLRHSRIRDHDLWSRAGGTITVDRHDELRVLDNPLSQFLPAMFQESQLSEQEWQEASGFSLFSQGRDAPGMNKTASGVAMLVREANNRINMIKLLTEHMTITADANHFISMNKQYITDNVRLNMIGKEEPFEVGPGNLWGSFSASPRIAPKEPMNMAIDRENFVFLYNLLMQSPNARDYNFGVLDERAMQIFDQEQLVNDVMSKQDEGALDALGSGLGRTPNAVQGARTQLAGNGQLAEVSRRLAA